VTLVETVYYSFDGMKEFMVSFSRIDWLCLLLLFYAWSFNWFFSSACAIVFAYVVDIPFVALVWGGVGAVRSAVYWKRSSHFIYWPVGSVLC
jgi:hypothetical protein